MEKQFIKIAHGMQITEPIILKIHKKAWRATFEMKLAGNMTTSVEIDAPTEERIKEKISHLKETGMILRG